MPGPGLCRVDGRGRRNPLVGGGGRGWVLGIFRWLSRKASSWSGGWYRAGLLSGVRCGPGPLPSVPGRRAGRPGWSRAWPSHSAIVEVSTPARRRVIAAVCRSVCGETRLVLRDGHRSAAVVTCLASRSATASGLSGPPARFGNSGSVGSPRRSVSQSRTTRAVGRVSGVQRSFRPLPRQRRFAPGPRVTSPRVRPVSSETRSPVWTATSSSR